MSGINPRFSKNPRIFSGTAKINTFTEPRYANLSPRRTPLSARSGHIDRIVSVLGRSTIISSLSSVSTALDGQPESTAEGNRIAFVLDANVILNLHRHAAVADYLAGEHKGLLILPGQAVQEFWNNRLSMQQAAQPVKQALASLKVALKDLGPEHKEFEERFAEVLTDFENASGQFWADSFRAKVATTFQAIAARAMEPQFPKDRLEGLARTRQATRTPPGFKDKGDGDLYIWAELLLGLLEGRQAGIKVDMAVLITQDKKTDWGKGGEAHPILVAEMRQLLDIPFATWDLKEMRDFTEKATDTDGEPLR